MNLNIYTSLNIKYFLEMSKLLLLEGQNPLAEVGVSRNLWSQSEPIL